MQKKIVVKKNMCPQNHPCPVVNVCPTGAVKQKTPFSAPEIDESKCTNCGLCTNACFAFQYHS